MRLIIPFAFILSPLAAFSQSAASSAFPVAPLPDAPSYTIASVAEPNGISTSLGASEAGYSLYPAGYEPDSPDPQATPTATHQIKRQNGSAKAPEVDANGNPIPLNRQQPGRILGFFPNFRSVSAGAAVHPPGWEYNFKIATRQAFDYSSFIFLGITSLSAEGLNSHPALRKGVHGFYSYTWRGLLDKTDTTYLSAWLLPSILHQDNRYFPLGDGHRVVTRVAYVISRQAVTRTYGGHETFNLSGLGGKILAQYISRFYYPPGSSDFSVLATKFGYGAARDVGFQSLREFYPDVAAHYIRKHREKVARQSAQDVQDSQRTLPPTP